MSEEIDYLKVAKEALNMLREPNSTDMAQYILAYAQVAASIGIAEKLQNNPKEKEVTK